MVPVNISDKESERVNFARLMHPSGVAESSRVETIPNEKNSVLLILRPDVTGTRAILLDT